MPQTKICLLATALALVGVACANGQAAPAAGDPVPATSSTTAPPTTAPSTTASSSTVSPSVASSGTATSTSLLQDPDGAPEPAADVVVDLELAGGAVLNDPGRIQVQAGDEVLIVVRSDSADQVHVHGYDVFGELEPGTLLEMRFTADTPGIYEVELEESHLLLFELQVNG